MSMASPSFVWLALLIAWSSTSAAAQPVSPGRHAEVARAMPRLAVSTKDELHKSDVEDELEEQLELDGQLIAEDFIKNGGMRILSTCLFFIIVSVLVGFVLAHKAKRETVMCRLLRYSLLVLIVGGGASFLVGNSVRSLASGLDQGKVSDMFVMMTDSFVKSFLASITRWRPGNSMVWEVELQNVLDTEITLEEFGGPIYVTVLGSDFECLICSLKEVVVLPPASWDTSVIAKVHVDVLNAALGFAAAMAVIVTPFGVTIEAQIKLWLAGKLKQTAFGGKLGETAFGLGMTGVVPFALAELPPINTWPDSLEGPDADDIVLASISSGLKTMHAEEPPRMIVDWRTVSATGFYAVGFWVVLLSMYFFLGILCVGGCFCFLRSCCQIAEHHDEDLPELPRLEPRTREVQAMPVQQQMPPHMCVEMPMQFQQMSPLMPAQAPLQFQQAPLMPAPLLPSAPPKEMPALQPAVMPAQVPTHKLMAE